MVNAFFPKVRIQIICDYLKNPQKPWIQENCGVWKEASTKIGYMSTKRESLLTTTDNSEASHRGTWADCKGGAGRWPMLSSYVGSVSE